MPEILIDTRESDETKDVLKIFLNCKEKMLKVGDIVVDDTVCFEHKTPQDFISSVFDGRLFTQIKAMRHNYPHSYVIVSGTMTELLETAEMINRYNSIMAAMCSCFRRGCPVIFCDTLVNLADVVKVLSEKLTDNKERSRPIVKITMEDKRLQLICSFSGVSENRGKALLNHFGTVKKVLSADADELQKVQDIGKVTAEGMREVLNA